MSDPVSRHHALGDFLEVKHGFAFKSTFFGSSGDYIVLTPGNFLEKGGFKDKGTDEKWYSGPVPPEYVLRNGDVVVAMTEQGEGLLGSSAIIPREDLYLHNQRIGLLRFKDAELSDPRFFYYLFNCRWVRRQIRASATGAKIRHTAPGRIAEVSVWVPDPREQRQIADILSAYDDLIENNLRRIQILEEMARAIYREWFVHFRFPGHERVKLVDSPRGSIPEGWDVRPLGDVCYVTMGQSPASEFYNEAGEGLPFHQGVKDFGARFPTDRVFCSCEGRLAEASDILFSVRAPVGRMNIANKRIVIGRGLSAIRHREGRQAFLWELLRDRFREEDTIGNGAIFAAVTKGELTGLRVLCPAAPVLDLASEVLTPLHHLTDVLTRQVANLRATRDLLLPRLMSGQLTLPEAEGAASVL